MGLRPPPGRAGRLWVLRRLEVGRRGVEVLDQKRQVLVREQRRLGEGLERASREWEQAARTASVWSERALALAGERRLRLAAGRTRGRCTVEVGWRNALGTVFPSGAEVRCVAAPDLVALGGGSSVALAAVACAEALVAAARHAAAQIAYDAITRELVATTRRQRAIERRWILEHEAALRRIELALDERELEDIARVRWAVGRAASASGSPKAL